MGRYPDGPQCVGIQKCRFGRAAAQQFAIQVLAKNVLFHRECSPRQVAQCRRGHYFVIKFCRYQKLAAGLDHYEQSSFLIQEYILFDPQGAQPFRPGALHKFEVVGVVHKPLRVCVLVIDAKWPCKWLCSGLLVQVVLPGKSSSAQREATQALHPVSAVAGRNEDKRFSLPPGRARCAS